MRTPAHISTGFFKIFLWTYRLLRGKVEAAFYEMQGVIFDMEMDDESEDQRRTISNNLKK
jgi:hypothetical protein